jgi:hypothetical protein
MQSLRHHRVGSTYQHPCAEDHDQAEQAPSDRNPERDDPAITSEEPPTRPQTKASLIGATSPTYQRLVARRRTNCFRCEAVHVREDVERNAEHDQ